MLLWWQKSSSSRYAAGAHHRPVEKVKIQVLQLQVGQGAFHGRVHLLGPWQSSQSLEVIQRYSRRTTPSFNACCNAAPISASLP